MRTRHLSFLRDHRTPTKPDSRPARESAGAAGRADPGCCNASEKACCSAGSAREEGRDVSD